MHLYIAKKKLNRFAVRRCAYVLQKNVAGGGRGDNGAEKDGSEKEGEPEKKASFSATTTCCFFLRRGPPPPSSAVRREGCGEKELVTPPKRSPPGYLISAGAASSATGGPEVSLFLRTSGRVLRARERNIVHPSTMNRYMHPADPFSSERNTLHISK